MRCLLIPLLSLAVLMNGCATRSFAPRPICYDGRDDARDASIFAIDYFMNRFQQDGFEDMHRKYEIAFSIDELHECDSGLGLFLEVNSKSGEAMNGRDLDYLRDLWIHFSFNNGLRFN